MKKCLYCSEEITEVQIKNGGEALHKGYSMHPDCLYELIDVLEILPTAEQREIAYEGYLGELIKRATVVNCNKKIGGTSMEVYTTTEKIELEMDRAIEESTEDVVCKTFVVDGNKVEEMLAHLEEKYDVFVGNYAPNNKLVSLSIEWVKSEVAQ